MDENKMPENDGWKKNARLAIYAMAGFYLLTLAYQMFRAISTSHGNEQLVMIVSRASGAPVIANAIRYAAQLVRGKVFEVAKEEFAAVKKAGLKEILDEHKASQKPAAAEEEVKEPPKEIVTAQIPGIEVMDLEDAVKVLWKLGI